MLGESGDTEGPDEGFVQLSMNGFGAFSLAGTCSVVSAGNGWTTAGRAGVAKIRPYHAPKFVVTHLAPEANAMAGDTTFHFVKGGIHATLKRARGTAGRARDVKIGGGVSPVSQHLQASLTAELHFALSHFLLGRSEPMFEGLNLPAFGYRVLESTATDLATHVMLGRHENE